MKGPVAKILFLVLLGLLFPLYGYADHVPGKAEINVVIPDKSNKKVNAIAESVAAELKKRGIKGSILEVDDPSSNQSEVIAITGKAVDQLRSKNPNQIVVGLFGKRSINNTDSRLSYIDSSAAPLRQLLYAQVLMGPDASCGLISTHDVSTLSTYKEASTKIGLPLDIVSISPGTKVNQIVEKVRDYNCIILIKDKALFKSISVKTLVDRLYKYNQQAVFSFSQRIVGTASAIGATHSGIGDMANEAISRIEDYRHSGKLAGDGYTRGFSLKHNDYIARSLNTVRLTGEEIKKIMLNKIEGGIDVSH